jgi:hypothetical protein
LATGPEGTEIHWHASFVPKLPGTGWLIRRRLAGITRSFVEGLAAHAARLEGDLAPSPYQRPSR